MSQVTEGQLRDIISLKAHRDPAFRKQLISNPKATVEGILGSSLGSVSVAVVQDTDSLITMVIPPAATDELSEDQLEAVAGGFLDATLGSSVLGDGMLCIGGGLINTRPFRAPHHSTTPPGLVGGGAAVPRPGEVTLAHHGVLFLDELPEFRKNVLEVLRQPLEEMRITIARAVGSAHNTNCVIGDINHSGILISEQANT